MGKSEGQTKVCTPAEKRTLFPFQFLLFPNYVYMKTFIILKFKTTEIFVLHSLVIPPRTLLIVFFLAIHEPDN